MNTRSSRSHVIFRMIIESHLITGDSVRSGDDTVKVSHLNFVDLAGRENMKHSGVSGQRLAETGSINQSLSALSLVIHQLRKGEKANYRNSKLTRILQNALGGNSKTAMICTINPAALEQSVTTLRFAKSAKTINKKRVVNKVVSGETMITITKRQINRRKTQCESKQRQKKAFDKRHRVVDLRPLKPGEHVWVKDMNRRGTVKTQYAGAATIVRGEDATRWCPTQSSSLKSDSSGTNLRCASSRCRYSNRTGRRRGCTDGCRGTTSETTSWVET